MKNIRSFGFALCALAASLMISCEKEEIIEKVPENVKTRTIAFGASCDWGAYKDVITKGGAATSGNRVDNRTLISSDSSQSLPMGIYVQDGIRNSSEIQTKGSVVNEINSFSVWCEYIKADAETDAINYFSNISYEKGSDDIYYPANTADEYYWPGAGTLNFVSIANAPTSGFVSKYNSSNTSIESFTYTVPADPTAQNDIMAATASAAGNSNTSVPLVFKHIMSAVNVKVGSVVKGEIRSITFKNVYNKGEYFPDRGIWVVDKNSTGDFTVKMEGGKFVSNGENPKETPINTSDATFMFIPQNPGSNAEMIIEFCDSEGHLYSDASGSYAPALRGSIADDNWDMSKTTNYMLSIDETFTMKIEPVGKKLDAHYIIGYANVTVEDIDSWTITASTKDGSFVTILPEEEVNPLAKQGFWTDKVVDDNGNITSESARGASSWTGSGDVSNKLFYIFIPENLNNKDREISLILKSNGSSTASTTKVLLQKYPNWTAGGFGWEVVDDDESGKYGFKWTRKVAYAYRYAIAKLWGTTKHFAFCQELVNEYGAGANNFATVGEFFHLSSVGYRPYILLDYTKLNSINGANSENDGFNNTLSLYRASGTVATSQFETLLLTIKKTESGKEHENAFGLPTSTEINEGCPQEEGENNDLSAIMEYVQKKNLYYIQTKYFTDSDGNPSVVHVPYFKEENLKWYLPGYGQFQYFTPDPNVVNDAAANYWSSTTAGTTTAWTGGKVEMDRDSEFKVIAVRKDENNFGQTTTTVDNSSLQGGNNGSTNNWVE